MVDEEMHEKVKELVSNGQLEILMGGWVMNDEACASYSAIIDQMSEGHRFVNHTFGIVPKTAWQIDPFGHSKAQASLFKSMGIDSFIFSRLSYDDHMERIKDARMEFEWTGSETLGANNSIFTSITYDHYSPPQGFYWDQVFSKDEMFQYDHKLTGYNVDRKCADFVNYVSDAAKAYRTPHIMITMGNDFNYQDGKGWFDNMDILQEYINDNYDNITVSYSTPTMYLNQVKHYIANNEVQIPSYNYDFFPYDSAPHQVWSGFYTSRPTQKHFVRKMNGYLQSCKQLDALDRAETKMYTQPLRHAVALTQHHDSITGTERTHVAHDYARRLSHARDHCEIKMNHGFDYLLAKDKANYDVTINNTNSTWTQCHLSNISVCDTTAESGTFVVNVWNPLMHGNGNWDVTRKASSVRMVPVRIPTPTNNAYVQRYVEVAPGEFQIHNVPSDILLNDSPYPGVNRTDMNVLPYTLHFLAENVPAMGSQTYILTVHPTNTTSERDQGETPKQKEGSTIVIDNGIITLNFDEATGLMTKFFQQEPGESNPNVGINISQDYYWYNSSIGGGLCKDKYPCFNYSDQASGAYIFRPNSTTRFSVDPGNHSGTIPWKHYQGHIVSEVTQTFGPYVTQRTRLYKGVPYAEIEYTVGPIDIWANGTMLGHEIISRFTTDMVTNKTMFSDSNGRTEYLKRLNNWRPWFNFTQDESVAGNYYPFVESLLVNETTTSSRHLQFFTDRSQGASALLQEGEIEIMVHRRMLADDSKGVAQPLNETGITGKGLVVRGIHRMVLSHRNHADNLRNLVQEDLHYPAVIAFRKLHENPQEFYKTYTTRYLGVSPKNGSATGFFDNNLRLLTFERLDHHHVLIRVENPYSNQDSNSRSISFSLEQLVKQNGLSIYHIEELALNGQHSELLGYPRTIEPSTILTVEPMMIRTFKVQTQFIYSKNTEDSGIIVAAVVILLFAFGGLIYISSKDEKEKQAHQTSLLQDWGDEKKSQEESVDIQGNEQDYPLVSSQLIESQHDEEEHDGFDAHLVVDEEEEREHRASMEEELEESRDT